jgi:pimeloyl-ACP methyl ester carboxylesterase
MYQSRRAASSETLTLRGIRHHLWRWGPQASPPVVLLHGWADTGETFQFVVDCLPDDWSLAALDWRGFGRSERAAGGAYWFPDYLADLDALLDALSPGRPARVVGHSMGANVLSLYGGARPERLERIALLEGFGLAAPPPAAAPERYRQWLEQLRGAPPRFASYASFDTLAGFLARRHPRLTLERAEFVARAWGEERAGRIAIRSDPAHKLIHPVLYRRDEAEACWRNITVPVLLMLGGRSEYLARLGPNFDAQGLAAIFPRAVAVTLPDCGHMLHHEEPQGVAAVLAQFFSDRR